MIVITLTKLTSDQNSIHKVQANYSKKNPRCECNVSGLPYLSQQTNTLSVLVLAYHHYSNSQKREDKTVQTI